MSSAEGSTALPARHRTNECSLSSSMTCRRSSAARGLRGPLRPPAACACDSAAAVPAGGRPSGHAVHAVAAAGGHAAAGEGVGDSTFCSARLHGAGGGVSSRALPLSLPLMPLPREPPEPAPVCRPVCGCGCGMLASAARGAAGTAAVPRSAACAPSPSTSPICTTGCQGLRLCCASDGMTIPRQAANTAGTQVQAVAPVQDRLRRASTEYQRRCTAPEPDAAPQLP